MIPLRDANPTRRRALVTLGIIALNAAVFGYELLIQEGGSGALNRLLTDFGLVPSRFVDALGHGQLVSAATVGLVSSQFLHAGWLHIGFNMLYLWIFGNNVEDLLGRLPYLLFYLGGGVAAALAEVGAQILAGSVSNMPLVGASGAVSAVLGAYLVWFPRARVLSVVYLGLFFQLVQVPAVLVLGLFFLLQLLDGVAALNASASAGGVAYFAHVGGFALGFAVALAVRAARRVSG